MTAAAGGDSLTTDRIYGAVALVAAVSGAVEVADRPWLLGLLVIALVPWGLVATGRQPALPLFALLALAPVVAIVAVHDVGSVVFVATASGSRAASRTDDRRVVVVLAVLMAGIPFVPLLTGHQPNAGAFYFAFGDLFGLLVGVLLRRATRLAAELREAQLRLTEAAGREERQRIARDVHDLVAHSLTVVVLHIGGARRVLRSEPQVAEQALADAERVCRESLDGIRGVVGLLRDTAEAPALSLDLDRLFDTYRAAGLAVSGSPADLSTLPLAVRVTLYRVVQEALANAARHGGPHPAAEVEVLVDAQQAGVRVTSSGADASTAPLPTAGGYGLVGLREQVAARGGQLTGGPAVGGWVVDCTLPLRAEPALAAPGPQRRENGERP